MPADTTAPSPPPSVASQSPTGVRATDGTFDVEVFFDGDCPLCRREIRLLERWDRSRRIRFTNLSELDFSDPALGKSFDELMAQMHGRLPDGRWIQGVEVFRRMYGAVGFRRLVAMSRWPLVRQTLDLGYRWFAKHRLRLTGRCSTDACALPPRDRSTADSTSSPRSTP